MLNFINTGADEDCVKSLSKQGLVQKEISVKGKHGTFIRKQWVSAPDTKPSKNSKPIDYNKLVQENYRKSKNLYFPLADSGNTRTTALSYNEILTYYSRNKKSIKMPVDDYIKSNYFISDGHNQTQELYKTSKGYTKERQKLHDTIIHGIVNSASSPKNGEKPVAILMGGGSASGKGTLRTSVVIPRLQADGVSVGISDCDEIKLQLPEYEHFLKQNPESAALRVHDESMDIAMEAMDALITNKKNLLFDGTMKDIHKYTKIIDSLHKAGYEVQIIGADIPVEVALQRSSLRAKQTGRKVPEGVIIGSHGGFSLTYPQLLDKVDKYSLYDNSGDYPVLIQDEHGIYDQERYNKFLDKGEKHNVDRTIRKLSNAYGVSQAEIRDLYDNGASLDEIEEYLDLEI